MYFSHSNIYMMHQFDDLIAVRFTVIPQGNRGNLTDDSQMIDALRNA